jgi:ferric-dicitrate binding protein FerR (iron transport regulator)
VQVGARIGDRDSAVVIGAGQMVSCRAGAFPGSPDCIGLPDYPGWMHGKFTFQQTSLTTACREIEERFDVHINVRDSSLFHKTITGSIDARTVESAISTLARLTGTQYQHANDSYTLY